MLWQMKMVRDTHPTVPSMLFGWAATLVSRASCPQIAGRMPATRYSNRTHHFRMVGEWTCEGEATMKPGKPPMKYEGTESVRSLGGLWILAEGQGDAPGCGPATTMMTLGYDPQKKRCLATTLAC